jgi:hypothetical protein
MHYYKPKSQHCIRLLVHINSPYFTDLLVIRYEIQQSKKNIKTQPLTIVVHVTLILSKYNSTPIKA